ncbi:acetyl-CoA carboxylase biotin carboxyl carrier protein [Bacillus niameyensis]|uniref:acetyl-CoA carboxylase biotin carboxyl carrier protein n=1 Tax=Bacillus niameyensis TaxID=1522308 RepID=UPI0007862812|nr:acetyl-CoA carboxylase biotin carboxyl carrier protein [Bacillus niameyensis]
MLKIQDIHEIIKMIDKSSIDEFVYEHEGFKIKLKKSSTVQFSNDVQQGVSVQPVVVQQPTQPEVHVQNVTANHETMSQPQANDSSSEEYLKITSPMVGTFYHASSPDVPAYVEVGSKVKPDTIVCIVEAMKLFNEIEAEVEGEIVEVLVNNGQLVEYGQPLFLVKPKK